MKEDILEQLVEDWFVARPGWFVKHNLKFRPSRQHKDYDPKKDSVHSDIDILAISGIETGKRRVAVVTCKSWQGGFAVSEFRAGLEAEPIYNTRDGTFKRKEMWKGFREITSDKWVEAFVTLVEGETAQKDFVYYIAVTKAVGTSKEKGEFENSIIIKDRLKKHNSHIDIKIITLQEIITDLLNRMRNKHTPTLESTDVGRILQLMRAANLSVKADDQPS